MSRLVIIVDKGVIQQVISDDVEIELIIVDRDCDDTDPGETQQVLGAPAYIYYELLDVSVNAELAAQIAADIDQN